MQYNFFNLGTTEKYKITKPIRLIELFGGIGSQAKALTNLGVDFEHYRLVEFDKYAIQSYNAIHNTNFIAQDITQTSASDLGIVETDKYEYIVTYSFPCTDLSLAGKREGMTKGSGTRSGLLWEVERILTECEELPQVLLMENVPQVLNNDFDGWLAFLESLGYHNYYELLNAKNYGIPQNRNRCFMVSVLGDYYYEFPKPIKLDLRLKDMLESNVDEKYYLSDKALNGLLNTKFACGRLEKRTEKNGIIPTLLARDYKDPKLVITTRAGSRPTDKFIESEPKCEQVAQLIGTGYTEMTGRIYSDNGLCPTIRTMQGGNLEPKVAIIGALRGRNPNNPSDRTPRGPTQQRLELNLNGTSNTLTTVQKDNMVIEKQIMARTLKAEKHDDAIIMNFRIRKLTPRECWRLMGFSDADIDKAKESGVSNCQLYKQAGNSIVVNVLMAIFREML